MSRPRRDLALRVAVSCAVIVLLTAGSCGGGTGSSGATGDLLPASPTALPTYSASEFNQLMAQLRGKPVVVNVWASWCGPCIFEAPQLAVVAATYEGQVQFVGVDIQDELKPARAFITKFGWTYPSVFDPQGAIRDSFGLLGVPHTLFFDATGARTFVWSGPVTQAILVNGIKGALHRTGSGSPASPGASLTPSPTGS